FGLGGLPLHPAAGGGLDGRLLFPDGVAAAPGLVLHFLDGPEDLPVPGLQVADGGGQAVLMGAGVGQALLPVRDAAAAKLGVLLEIGRASCRERWSVAWTSVELEQ